MTIVNSRGPRWVACEAVRLRKACNHLRFAQDALATPMSRLLPSFQTIYRQGRFREQQAPGSKDQMQQGERFTVACLGFVLHHDVAFRSDFLRRICDWKEPETAEGFEVSIELFGCGDLALESRASGAVFVIECKIGAGLQTNQIPDEDAFFKTGYGFGMLRDFAHYGGPGMQRTYITLTQTVSESNYHGCAEVTCKSKTWLDLCEGLKPDMTAPLISDLFKTFAEHHIRCFAAWNMNTYKLKLASHQFGACQISALLENTAALIKTQFGLNAARTDDFELKTVENSYIGRALICKNSPPEWLNLTGQSDAPGNEHLAWFGYAWNAVQVGFYCKGDAAMNAVQMLQRIKRPGEQASERDEGGYVWINTPDNPFVGDQEWILSIFERLRQTMIS